MRKDNFLVMIWNLIYPILIYFGITMVVSVIFSMVNGLALQAELMADGQTLNFTEYTNKLTEKVYGMSMLMTFIAATVTTPLMIFFYRNDIKKRKQEYNNRPSFIWYLPIVVVSILACISVNVLLSLSNLGKVFPGFEEVSKAIYGGSIVWEVLAACVAAPVIEELIFRGIVYSRARNNMKPIVAMIVSSFLFGAYHMNVVQGVYAFIIGMLFVFIYEKYKTIWAPIIAHMSANLMSVIISETSIFNALLESIFVQIIVAVVGLALGICILYLMNKKIKVNLIDKEPVMYDQNGKVIN